MKIHKVLTQQPSLLSPPDQGVEPIRMTMFSPAKADYTPLVNDPLNRDLPTHEDPLSSSIPAQALSFDTHEHLTLTLVF